MDQSREASLNSISDFARSLAAAKGWAPRSVQDRLTFLLSEMVELQSALESHESHPTAMSKQAVGFEMYDIIWNICDMANLLGVDLNNATIEKQKILMDRDWRHKI